MNIDFTLLFYLGIAVGIAVALAAFGAYELIAWWLSYVEISWK